MHNLVEDFPNELTADDELELYSLCVGLTQIP